MRVTLMVDGSFCPDTGAGGFGYWIAAGRGKKPGGGPLKGIHENSTEVEMKAICNALVEGINSGLIEPGDEVLIQTDSKWAIRAFCGYNPQDAEYEKASVEFFLRYKKHRELKIEFRHVKGHSNAPGARFAANNHCDTRAKQGMRKMRRQIKEGIECSSKSSASRPSFGREEFIALATSMNTMGNSLSTSQGDMSDSTPTEDQASTG